MKYLFFFCTVIFFVLASCKESPKVQGGLYFKNNIESSLGWCGHATITKTNDAHSGDYVSKIDSINIYSLGFELPLSTVNERFIPVVEVRATVWVMLRAANAKGVLITEIRKSNKTIYWTSLKLSDFCKEPGKWCKVEKILKLNENDLNNNENIYRVFVANDSKQEIFVDDFEIEFIN